MNNQEKFDIFHDTNPGVYVRLVRITRAISSKGFRCSINGAFEVLRYQINIDINDPNQKQFRILDTYKARYARMIMDKEPDLAGVFRTKKIRIP
jgi:acetolactate synthase regulatory subunit